MLNLARIESGRVEYAWRTCEVARLLASVTPMVEPQLAAKGLVFAWSVGGPLAVRADREKMQQIVINLLSNAIKFTPPGGRVSVAGVQPRATGPAPCACA